MGSASPSLALRMRGLVTTAAAVVDVLSLLLLLFEFERGGRLVGTAGVVAGCLLLTRTGGRGRVGPRISPGNSARWSSIRAPWEKIR